MSASVTPARRYGHGGISGTALAPVSSKDCTPPMARTVNGAVFGGLGGFGGLDAPQPSHASTTEAHQNLAPADLSR